LQKLGRVDELGSGVINVNRFIQEYAERGEPTFSEGHTFKMTIPLPAIDDDIVVNGGVNGGVTGGVTGGVIGGTNGGTNGGTIEGATKGVKEKLSALLSAIAVNEGGRAPEYMQMVKFSERSIERYLQQLKEVGLIEFRGDAPKTGGYYLTKELRNKFDEQKE
jgi:ATP-dependent DNA helicase RecG